LRQGLLPELARLPASAIPRPWSATPLERVEAGVELGKTSPETGRERTLEAGREGPRQRARMPSL
jgi:hypothetical protein